MEVERFLFDAYRRMPPWEKVRRVRELCRASQRLALAGIVARYPRASAEELRFRLAATRFDRDTLMRIFPAGL